MSDTPMPEDVIAWMQGLNWGPHHDQWHFERRWDFWHRLAEQGDEDVREMIRYAESQHWHRAGVQEGQAGNGLDFLMMHRAMLQLIVEQFPQHEAYVRGWPTPPTDPQDAEDPVPSGDAFDANKAQGIQAIENDFDAFANDDAYGLFIETNIRPLPADPTHRDPDGRLGIHNYLHNRWTDQSSPINLGDPKVNLMNARFWKLHGWIDHQWQKYRAAKGFSDADPQYVATLAQYKHMMGHHMHPMMTAHEGHGAAIGETVERPAAFGRIFQF
jgi:hypothetical protein